MADLEYRDDGLFVRFYPNTPAGESAWREMAKQDGIAAVLAAHAKGVIAKLRRAGYGVRKATKPAKSVEDLLEELGA